MLSISVLYCWQTALNLKVFGCGSGGSRFIQNIYPLGVEYISLWSRIYIPLESRWPEKVRPIADSLDDTQHCPQVVCVPARLIGVRGLPPRPPSEQIVHLVLSFRKGPKQDSEPHYAEQQELL